jgi:hypothetical protein
LRRFEQHILPKGFVKIRHAGYLHAKNKMERIASVCRQLKLPAPMQRVHTPLRTIAESPHEKSPVLKII